MDMLLCAKTLGRRPGCVVMNIGAVMFDRSGEDAGAPMRGENQLYEAISAFDSHTLKLTSDPETLRWWKKQDSWKVVGEEFMHSTTSVATACDRLGAFIAHHQPTKIWSNSPTFHIEVLRALHDRAGKEMPIAYRQEMDYRTLMDLVYVDRSQRPDMGEVPGFPKQHAIGDAVSQSRSIIQALKDINPKASDLLNRQRWVMLDVETLGRRPGYAIMTIGANRFSAEADRDLLMKRSNHFYSVIDSFDTQNNGFKVDPVTLKWWKNEPIWKDLSAEIRHSTTSVHKACVGLGQFLEEHRPDKVWANSPSFDIEMLRAMFKRMRVDFPIAYRQEMDFRTLMELVYPDREDRPQPELGSLFPKHHALGDAMEQSIQVQKAMLELNMTRAPDVAMARRPDASGHAMRRSRP